MLALLICQAPSVSRFSILRFTDVLPIDSHQRRQNFVFDQGGYMIAKRDLTDKLAKGAFTAGAP
jgi:hypothetical protein